MVNWHGVSEGDAAIAQALIQTSPQGNQPPSGDTLLNSTDNMTAKRHMGPTGKPCITVIGDARPQMINPQIFDHIIDATNTCPRKIKLNVCYYHSQDCIPVEVPPYSYKEAVLGIMPAMNAFRFEYREIFSPYEPN
jgi:hypothetical protein